MVERQIRQQIGPTTVVVAVVLWPSDRSLKPRQIDGLAVLPGWEPRAWLDALPPDQLDGQRSEGAWSSLKTPTTSSSHWARAPGDPVQRHARRTPAVARQTPKSALTWSLARANLLIIPRHHPTP